jgi:hypothetical protein
MRKRRRVVEVGRESGTRDAEMPGSKGTENRALFVSLATSSAQHDHSLSVAMLLVGQDSTLPFELGRMSKVVSGAFEGPLDRQSGNWDGNACCFRLNNYRSRVTGLSRLGNMVRDIG